MCVGACTRVCGCTRAGVCACGCARACYTVVCNQRYMYVTSGTTYMLRRVCTCVCSRAREYHIELKIYRRIDAGIWGAII